MKKAGKRVLFGSLLLVVLMFTMTFTVFAARNIPKKVRAIPNQTGGVTLTLNQCEYIKTHTSHTQTALRIWRTKGIKAKNS